MKINWKVRIKNKTFWLAIIPALAVLIKAVFAVFGIETDFTEIVNRLINLVEALFVVFAILGIVVDHTTSGLSDSEQAMGYEVPRES